VVEAARRLAPAQSSLVIEHAKGKTRPDWLPGAELTPPAPVWSDPLHRGVKVIRHQGTGRHARYVRRSVRSSGRNHGRRFARLAPLMRSGMAGLRR